MTKSIYSVSSSLMEQLKDIGNRQQVFDDLEARANGYEDRAAQKRQSVVPLQKAAIVNSLQVKMEVDFERNRMVVTYLDVYDPVTSEVLDEVKFFIDADMKVCM